MQTTTEIKEKLNGVTEWQPWMDELTDDSRKSVQVLLASWQRKQVQRKKLLENHNLKLQFDDLYRKLNSDFVAGIDEAGRGPLAGPVVTAAVILPEDCSSLIGLDDSKQLSRAKRDQFAEIIKRIAVSYAVHVQPPEEIDRINIYQATRSSMTEAALALSPKPVVVLADAMMLELPMPCQSIIKGDAKSLSIAAASILAKTGRDALMADYAVQYPQYGFEKHAGYGTKEHVAALGKHGPCKIHRTTFEPIKSILTKNSLF
ncbi:ribonuclease HII [Planococcus antarcticus DSM 14505]|uniref:Ribonuclease HII n=1 Tax=Planococcus antarcticus DSM 14505 TaxID=1185653 RepID=A0A1C7DGA8_9BACL|nr:ribonuclease HII [Planococcus antarcticus]ANU10536.1 ribonuclease HII [Planococcus antarcticus DSM 14505]EIM08390.1 ribonuclease HII [Planococcus antarcticus DSM 14505]